MENFLDEQTLSIIIRLAVAILLGMVIGVERVWAGKIAGMRTYALVSMGSALFIVISELVAQKYIGLTNFDPLRVASQIIVGVGFIGSGLIFTQNSKPTGLTTATGLWVSSGIGIASGFGLFNIAIMTTILTLFIFVILWFVEQKVRKSKPFGDILND